MILACCWGSIGCFPCPPLPVSTLESTLIPLSEILAKIRGVGEEWVGVPTSLRAGSRCISDRLLRQCMSASPYECMTA